MKKIQYFTIMVSALILGVTSCAEWLDVNTDPDSPNNESALVENRLPWIQKFFAYSSGLTAYRTSCSAGMFWSSGGGVNQWSVTWQLGSTTTPVTSYQTWFVEVAGNLNDMYNKAEKEGAYHYMAASNVFHALGFMQLLDLFGEIPYSEALRNIASPVYDDGKTIYEGCLAKLDEAIELFGRTQETGATPLSKGDMYNNGDVSKWIKYCYGLKARWLLKLSKKTEFNPQEILDCLSKAPQSNADNNILRCFNVAGDEDDYLLGDPISTNPVFDYLAYGATQRVTKYLYDMLTNMRGSGVEDPRMTKIVPAMMSNIKLDPAGRVQSYQWLRSSGVDIMGSANRLVAGGAASIVAPTFVATEQVQSYSIANSADREAFIAGLAGKRYTVDGNVVTVTYPPAALVVVSDNYILSGDSVYVSLRQCATTTSNVGFQGEMDMNFYLNAAAWNAGAVGSTGTFQARPVSDYELLTYHEMCFIRAEVLMRNGDQAGALNAYKEGIRAHLNMMQAKLTEWRNSGYQNPDMWPMDAAEMEAYLSSAAVCQAAGELTMADIMLQKYIAMGCSIENWNDMRRFNYSAGNIGSFGVVYPGFGRGPLFAGQNEFTSGSPTELTYWQRRWRLPDNLELMYNRQNALAMNKNALSPTIWSIPVWWDCATDQEYYGYIQ